MIMMMMCGVLVGRCRYMILVSLCAAVVFGRRERIDGENGSMGRIGCGSFLGGLGGVEWDGTSEFGWAGPRQELV